MHTLRLFDHACQLTKSALNLPSFTHRPCLSFLIHWVGVNNECLIHFHGHCFRYRFVTNGHYLESMFTNKFWFIESVSCNVIDA